MSKHPLQIIVGLGKTGMSCVRYLAHANIAVVDSRPNPPGLAELQRDFPQIPVFLGTFAVPILNSASEIILSPGVSRREPAIADAAQKIPIIGDIELFMRSTKAPIVAITGSNGKSTVTTLVGEMARNAGINAKVGGNLGTPVLDLLDDAAELYVLELSSAQLETAPSLRTKTAVVLNVTEDHLDCYLNFNEYLVTKQKIYNNCEIPVINRDAPIGYNGVKLPNKVISFGFNDHEGFNISDGYINHANKKMFKINELKIKGLHQAANAMAALALGTAIDLPQHAMLKTLREFTGLPHRCQWVAKINCVDWYDDSKGTNVGASIAAIEGLGQEISGKIVLIAGGLGKGADFTPLQDPVKKYVRAVILIGKDAPKIAQALQGCAKLLPANSMAEAVNLAYQQAQPQDLVLLSPACASFDMFNNFEHRGDEFARLAQEIKA